MTKEKKVGGVSIGNVEGGIHGSVIAGRDVKDVTITIGGQSAQAEKEPTVEELKQLLAEIQAELAEVTAEKEALAGVDAAAPFTAQGAEACIKEATDKVEGDVKKEQAKSIQQSLTNATTLLSGILDGAKTVAEKAGEVGEAVKPIAEKLAPLVDKVGVAALWVGKLWLG